MPTHDLPAGARPREKLLARGPAALSDTELLALLLRSGAAGGGVLQLAQDLLRPADAAGFGGIAELLNARPDGVKQVKGLCGSAKRAELAAVLELARRALHQQLQEREVFSSPGAVKQYLQLRLAARPHEVFAVLFLDAQNRLAALEELFRGTLTQTSVYPREVVQPSRADEALTQTLKSALGVGGRPRARSRGRRPGRRVLEGRTQIDLR